MSKSCEWIKVPGFYSTYDAGCDEDLAVCISSSCLKELEKCPYCCRPLIVKDHQDAALELLTEKLSDPETMAVFERLNNK